MSGDILIKFLVAAVLAGTPFLFGTVGEILSEKVGHLNLGVEGMMSLAPVPGLWQVICPIIFWLQFWPLRLQACSAR